MLRAVAAVRDEVLRQCGAKTIDLHTVTRVFVAQTVIDQIIFVQFDAPKTNPIFGEFTRWSKQPGASQAHETIVEIRYATHLDEPWRRYVVCKELCHSLDVSEGVCDVSASGMQNLVAAFSLISAGSLGSVSPSVRSELTAHTGALELLCPLAQRKQIVKHGIPNPQQLIDIAAKYVVPVELLDTAFSHDAMKAAEWLMNNGR